MKSHRPHEYGEAYTLHSYILTGLGLGVHFPALIKHNPDCFMKVLVTVFVFDE